MNMYRSIIVLIILASFSFTVDAQNDRLAPYLKIHVLKDSIGDVEKLFGKGKSEHNPYFVTYKSRNLIVSVDYALGPCGTRSSIWNVPEWTVTEVSYEFRTKPPRLTDLLGKQNRIKPINYGDVGSQIQYPDRERGISILFDKHEKRVTEVSVFPSINVEKRLACSDK